MAWRGGVGWGLTIEGCPTCCLLCVCHKQRRTTSHEHLPTVRVSSVYLEDRSVVGLDASQMAHLRRSRCEQQLTAPEIYLRSVDAQTFQPCSSRSRAASRAPSAMSACIEPSEAKARAAGAGREEGRVAQLGRSRRCAAIDRNPRTHAARDRVVHVVHVPVAHRKPTMASPPPVQTSRR